jgi:hypothetical protein
MTSAIPRRFPEFRSDRRILPAPPLLPDDRGRALLLRLEPGVVVPRHRHLGEVHVVKSRALLADLTDWEKATRRATSWSTCTNPKSCRAGNGRREARSETQRLSAYPRENEIGLSRRRCRSCRFH